MAQLKDLLVNGASRLIGDTFVNKIQITTLNAPTSAGGTTYGPGTNGYVLKSNGASIYWGNALGSDSVGATDRPIYLNNGTLTQCDMPESGNYFRGVPRIHHDGVMEIGKYIDFHNSNAATTDYDIRLTASDILTSSTTFEARGWLKSTSNSNTVEIGSRNTGFCHIYNSANIPFIFNNTVETTGGDLGSTGYPWGNLYMGTANGSGIYYEGTTGRARMITFIDNTSDGSGNGISIGGGGQTIIGGGESANTATAQAGTAGAEIMQVCNDGDVQIISNLQNGWDSRKTLTLNTSGYLMCPSYINVPTSNNENPTVSQFIVTNGDHYYRKASTAHAMAAIRGAASGSWGISITGNAATATKATQDSDGNAINTTYLKLTGGNMTGNLFNSTNIWAGINADGSQSSAVECDIGTGGPAGMIYFFSGGTSRGIHSFNSSSTSKRVLTIDSNNNVSLDGNAISFGKGAHAAAVTTNEFGLVEGQATIVGNVSNSTMPHTSNANAEMVIKAHPTSGSNYYEARLGFSSDQNLYFMPVNTNIWKKIAWGDNLANEFSWTGDITYDPHNNRFTNTRTTNVWASQIYSKHGFANGCYVSFRVEDTTHYRMVGLDSNPAQSASYDTIDYCWYPQADGGLNIYENGNPFNSISGHTTYVAGDDFRIEYSQGYVRYYHNGVLCRSVSREISGQLYADSSFYNGGTITDLRFGPLSEESYTGKYLWSGSANPVYGTNRLEYFNAHGTQATPTANATAYPTSDWYHFLRMNHGNSLGYYVEIASHFHSDNMYWRRVVAGTAYGWKKVAWADGTNSSGTWGIGITGNAATATTATYATYPKIVAGNEIRLDVSTKPSNAIALCWAWAWSDGSKDAKIDRHNFYNGNGAFAEIQGSKVHGAVWNDYAEYRKDNPNENQEPGRCVKELGDGSLALTTKRLERGCEIVSDTFGFAIGQDEDNGYNTPIASNGRVLAYPYESIEEFANHIGWPVCSGPNGTVSIMTEEEEEKYPSRIIGTISEIPTYQTWGTGNVEIDGRIWIRIK